MKLFKTPDACGSFGRFMWDSCYVTFWKSVNIFGKIILFPSFLLFLVISLLIIILTFKNKEDKGDE